MKRLGTTRDERIEEEAAAWLARLHSDTCSAKDRERFRAWLVADDRHAKTFEELTAAWDALGLADGSDRPLSVTRKPSLVSRRSVMAGLAASVVGGGALAGWSAAYAGVHETEVGEQKRITLPDGTRAVLDTDTKIRFRDLADVREVELYRGQVNLVTSATASKSFRVQAGCVELSTSRAAFDVSLTDEATAEIVVAEGAVRCRNESNAHISLIQSGQIVTSENSAPVPISIEKYGQMTAWHTGRLIFSNDDLKEVVTKLNRYSNTKIILLDNSVESMKVSGTFHTGNSDNFAKSIAIMLPVKVISMPDGVGIRAI